MQNVENTFLSNRSKVVQNKCSSDKEILVFIYLTTWTRTCLNINLLLKSLKYGINKMVYPKLPFCRNSSKIQ
jgi:hypothetical protein